MSLLHAYYFNKICSIMGFNPKSISATLENIVYFELLRKGYQVYVGKNETKEVDFVAVQRDELATGNVNKEFV